MLVGTVPEHRGESKWANPRFEQAISALRGPTRAWGGVGGGIQAWAPSMSVRAHCMTE